MSADEPRALWIKWPRAGQFRGEGDWINVHEAGVSVANWRWYRDTGYLPTHVGEGRPDAGPIAEGAVS